MRRRVLFVTTVFDDVATGPGIYARYLWQGLRDDDEIEFHVVAPGFREPHFRLHPVGRRGPLRSVYRDVATEALALAARLDQPPIVHGNAAHAMLGFAGYRGPWLVQVNDYEVATLWSHARATLLARGPRRLISLAWRRRREARAVRAATRVVCNSEFTRDAVLAAYRPGASKVVTIHKAVDTSAFARPEVLPPDPLPCRPAGARLAFVGTNWQIKGLDVLLKATARLKATHPGVTLAVAGQDPSATGGKVRRLVRGLGLSDRVFFTGRLDRAALAALLWHADVFVLPSRQEAFGVSALEALAAGVPVVASDVGGLGEILRDAAHGVLCPPDSPRALAEAIGGLLGAAARRRELARPGPARAAQFSLDRMIRAVRELYLSLPQ